MCTNPTEIPHYKNDATLENLNLYAVSSNKFLFFFVKKWFCEVNSNLINDSTSNDRFKKNFKYLIQRDITILVTRLLITLIEDVNL